MSGIGAVRVGLIRSGVRIHFIHSAMAETSFMRLVMDESALEVVSDEAIRGGIGRGNSSGLVAPGMGACNGFGILIRAYQLSIVGLSGLDKIAEEGEVTLFLGEKS